MDQEVKRAGIRLHANEPYRIVQLYLRLVQHGSMPARPTSERPARFPNRIRELRMAAGLTQEELGQQLGVTFSAVGKLERGESRLRIDQVKSLSKILRINELELFLPISPEEREALDLLRTAEPAMRTRMLQMLRMMAEPIENGSTKAA